MVRILNFVCFALSALACLALYDVSEQARMAHVDLYKINKKIAVAHQDLSVLQARWARLSDPSHIQELAHAELGINDTPVVELSSFEMLPRRGEGAPLAAAPVRNASDIAPAAHEDPRIHLASVRPGN